MNNDQDKKCSVCGINSTVLDGERWVCALHIEPCKCTRNHDLLREWDFNEYRHYGISSIVESMEFESPTPDVPGHDDKGNWIGNGDPMPKLADIDRRNDPEIKKWLKG